MQRSCPQEKSLYANWAWVKLTPTTSSESAIRSLCSGFPTRRSHGPTCEMNFFSFRDCPADSARFRPISTFLVASFRIPFAYWNSCTGSTFNAGRTGTCKCMQPDWRSCTSTPSPISSLVEGLASFAVSTSSISSIMRSRSFPPRRPMMAPYFRASGLSFARRTTCFWR